MTPLTFAINLSHVAIFSFPFSYCVRIQRFVAVFACETTLFMPWLKMKKKWNNCIYTMTKHGNETAKNKCETLKSRWKTKLFCHYWKWKWNKQGEITAFMPGLKTDMKQLKINVKHFTKSRWNNLFCQDWKWKWNNRVHVITENWNETTPSIVENKMKQPPLRRDWQWKWNNHIYVMI